MLYREEQLATYIRAGDIMINNPLPSSGLAPAIRFNEERAIKTAEGELISIGGYQMSCGLELTPETALTEFPLINPETDEVIGSATYVDLQVLLYSLYVHAADLRDNAEPEEAIPLPEGVVSVLDMEPPTS